MKAESNHIRKILIAEDDPTSAELLKNILEKNHYLVAVVPNGKKAYDEIREQQYDILLTDWMMPWMDGIELIKKVREKIKNPPLIIVITSLSSQEARNHALASGADEYIAKPYKPNIIIEKLNNLFLRVSQKPSDIFSLPAIIPETNPPFIGICIAASSGGPQTLLQVIRTIPVIGNAAIFVIQHGPQWVLLDMVESWKKICNMDVVLGSDGMAVKPGRIYLAPAQYHMTIEPGSLFIKLNNDPPVNFIKPAADPLFKSVARSFGKYSISVVLSGMGCDGTLGSQYISSVGGIVIAQDPSTAIVPYMPAAVIESVPEVQIIPIQDISDTIIKYSIKKNKNLSEI